MDTQQNAAILIVDDIALNRELLRNIFTNLYSVEEASNGRIALDLMKEKDISAVLLDIVMPEIDGYGVLNAMRADAALADIPVIVITANEDEESQLKALDLGAMDVIGKPINPRMVQARVRNAIEKRHSQLLATRNKVLKMQLDQQEQAIKLAEHDSLTGLLTRDTFCRRASEMITERPEGYYTIACFDVEGFKAINDQYSVAVGNHVLQFVAELLNRFTGKCGGIASRLFTDNFCVLFPAAERPMHHAEPDEKDGLTAIFLRDGYHFTLQFSVGCYHVAKRSLAVGGMLDRAILAKSTVKGRYDVHLTYYNTTMRETLLEEQWIVHEMERSLWNDQFEVWFQPQYDHATGMIVGAEALVRWRHPEKGLISPGVFIPIFERNGFIYALDKYIWEHSCAYLHDWIKRGLEPYPISVNVSRYDIFRIDFFETITGYIRRYRIPLELFRLEITESAFAKSTDQIIVIVKRLRDYGLTVEIDDFGSGYSSFNTLKDVPANVLKIDMRFLVDSGHAGRGGNILEAVVRMAKWLKMDVIAEGVETREQADFLRSVGCTCIQGFLYARPMPVDEYEKLLGAAAPKTAGLLTGTAKDLYTEAFWSPTSIDTLVFNRFSGGACVFEHWNGKLEMLRVNERFAECFHKKMTTESVLGKMLSLNECSNADLTAAIDRALRSGEPETIEIMYVGDGDLCEYIRMTLRTIAHADDRSLFYAYVENVTERRLAELSREETERRLRFLNGVSRGLLTTTDLQRAVYEALDKVLRYFDGTAAYVLELDVEHNRVNRRYEVNRHGPVMQNGYERSIPLPACRFWIELFQTKGSLYIENVELMGEELAVSREDMLSKKVGSLIEIAVRCDDKLIGALGINNPQQHSTAIEHLEALGDYTASILTRCV